MAVCLNSQSVYLRKRTSVGSTRWQLLAAALLLAILSAKVWMKLESTDLGYQLASERQKTVDLDMERRELDLQLSVLMRPDNLERSAKSKAKLGDHVPARTLKLTY